MIRVYVKKQSKFAVNAPMIKKELTNFLEGKVFVSFVGEKVMKSIASKYLGESSVHNVLSFPESELRGEFKYPKNETSTLGEIVICYPEILKEANDEGKLIDNKAIELVKHGALHLMGEHHEN